MSVDPQGLGGGPMWAKQEARVGRGKDGERERSTQWKKGTSHAGLVPGKVLLGQESRTEEARKVHQKPL